MIIRILIPVIVVLVLTDVFFDRRWLRRKSRWLRLLWWLPTVALIGWAVWLALQPGFDAGHPAALELFLLTLGLVAAPKTIYALCSLCGRLVSRISTLFKHRRAKRVTRNYGNLVGLAGVLLTWYVVLYGAFVGFYQVEVHHVDLTFANLPAAFDGYRIVQFSDAHVGTLRGDRQQLLRTVVDSINAQRPDLVTFTGDLQNTQPQDIYPHMELLASVKARDGVCSVLGNHDYAEYIDAAPATKVANCRETVSLERQIGWNLLSNSNMRLQRGKSSIVVAGMENDGEGRFPQLGDVRRALEGVGKHEFVVMLEHDPTSWQRKILPECGAQLTLSGHTHGGQLSLFGWSPASLRYNEYAGLYEHDGRWLYISPGIGGLIPFRFGLPAQVEVITLHSQKRKL